ncbi:hypothetical protein AMATHDRAFT_1412 [Amanita thiersii Skay4041]|uniref:STAS domain-containing protein n=1 Tax=Amanita thiersii Skay4041 TaxID=703135 RepID=A0A2A9NZI8_9AGAR|nr:hypothetical protein AMATHDRAFT_1412 [Amanita thiersii Skay4041]
MSSPYGYGHRYEGNENRDPLADSSSSLQGIDAVSRISGDVFGSGETSDSERTPLLYGAMDTLNDAGGSGSGYLRDVGSGRGSDPKRTLSKLKRRIKYYIPSFAWIPNYSPSLLGGDFLAGLTVASMLIPQSVSYASSLAKLNPVTGLFSASIPGIIYAFFGSSRQLNVAPEAALSLLIGQAVTDFQHDLPDPQSPEAETLGLAVATAITLQAGLFTFLLGFFRLGFMDVVLSRALLRGFVSAIAVIIMVEQLPSMFGLTALMHTVHPDTTLQKITFILENAPTHAHKATAIISFSALFALIFMRAFKDMFKGKWWIYRLPEVFIVVVASTILCAKSGWDQDGVDILGSVPITTGESFFQFPVSSSNIAYLHRTTSIAVLISVVGFLDSIVAAKQNAARFSYSISPNRELVALGVSNITGSFIPGTLPAYGSITRSRINADVGARSQMASLVCSAFVLLATFFVLPWLYYLPKCVLAAIICLVVFSLLAETPHDVVYYWKMRAWVDLGLMILTFVLSIVKDVEVGVVVSLIISLLLVVRRSSKPRMTILGRIPGTNSWKSIKENPDAQESVDGVLIVRIRESLDFANTAQLKERLRRLELYGVGKSHPSERPRRQEASILVFHMADVESCDASAAQIFCELLDEYRSRGVGLFITHLRSGPYRTFEKAGIVKMLGLDAFRMTVADAITIIEGSR